MHVPPTLTEEMLPGALNLANRVFRTRSYGCKGQGKFRHPAETPDPRNCRVCNQRRYVIARFIIRGPHMFTGDKYQRSSARNAYRELQTYAYARMDRAAADQIHAANVSREEHTPEEVWDAGGNI